MLTYIVDALITDYLQTRHLTVSSRGGYNTLARGQSIELRPSLHIKAKHRRDGKLRSLLCDEVHFVNWLAIQQRERQPVRLRTACGTGPRERQPPQLRRVRSIRVSVTRKHSAL